MMRFEHYQRSHCPQRLCLFSGEVNLAIPVLRNTISQTWQGSSGCPQSSWDCPRAIWQQCCHALSSLGKPRGGRDSLWLLAVVMWLFPALNVTNGRWKRDSQKQLPHTAHITASTEDRNQRLTKGFFLNCTHRTKERVNSVSGHLLKLFKEAEALQASE